jgi:hypothetical protein
MVCCSAIPSEVPGDQGVDAVQLPGPLPVGALTGPLAAGIHEDVAATMTAADPWIDVVAVRAQP